MTEILLLVMAVCVLVGMLLRWLLGDTDGDFFQGKC